MLKKEIVFDFAFDLGSEPDEVLPIGFVYKPIAFFMICDDFDDGWTDDDWDEDESSDDEEDLSLIHISEPTRPY